MQPHTHTYSKPRENHPSHRHCQPWGALVLLDCSARTASGLKGSDHAVWWRWMHFTAVRAVPSLRSAARQPVSSSAAPLDSPQLCDRRRVACTNLSPEGRGLCLCVTDGACQQQHTPAGSCSYVCGAVHPPWAQLHQGTETMWRGHHVNGGGITSM